MTLLHSNVCRGPAFPKLAMDVKFNSKFTRIRYWEITRHLLHLIKGNHLLKLSLYIFTRISNILCVAVFNAITYRVLCRVSIVVRAIQPCL